MKWYWLTTHLPYACRHSGACCTARWPVPIERERAAAVQAAVDAREVTAPPDWYRPDPQAPPDIAGILALQPSGACVFHQPFSPRDRGTSPGGCAIHPMRPASCAHFPYVCVIDARGVHVTLSHFCPTAADLLFDAPTPVAVVEGPAIFPDRRMPEGLDAREALPPAAEAAGRSAWLMSWDEVTAFERAYLSRLAEDTRVPEAPPLSEFERARASTPPGWHWPESPADVDTHWNALVAPAWPQWSRVIGRYLAAKAHASWAMHLGRGAEDVERLVDLARTVLQVELVRHCLATRESVSRRTLKAAIRQADLLLLHHADPERLCAGR